MRKFKCVECLRIYQDKDPCTLKTSFDEPKNCPIFDAKANWFEIKPCTMETGERIENVLDELEQIMKGKS